MANKWVSASDLADELGIEKRTLLARSRAIRAAKHVRHNRDGSLSLDAAWFRADHERLKKSAPTRGPGGKFASKTPAERVAAKRAKNRRDDEKKTRPALPPTATFDGDFSDLMDVDDDTHAAPSDTQFIDHLDERRKWAAKIEQVKFRRMAGEFLLREVVKREAFEMARLARDQLIAIPDRISGMLAVETDQHKIFSILDTEIRRVLVDLSDRASKIDTCDAVTLDDPVEGGA